MPVVSTPPAPSHPTPQCEPGSPQSLMQDSDTGSTTETIPETTSQTASKYTSDTPESLKATTLPTRAETIGEGDEQTGCRELDFACIASTRVQHDPARLMALRARRAGWDWRKGDREEEEEEEGGGEAEEVDGGAGFPVGDDAETDPTARDRPARSNLASHTI
jgi:hypothetical protein